MTNSIVRRSLAVTGAALFLSGLLAGGASAAQAVTEASVAPQLRCISRVEPPARDEDTIRAIAVTSCGHQVDVVRVRVMLEKFEAGEWRTVAHGAGRNQEARRVEAVADVQCQRGRYRAVSMHFASDSEGTNTNRKESDPVQIWCR
ncbi:hypothetical protein JOF56_003878 [Kibdelosporangium banguiense]|uniref:Secreted protein n=1 Tax=Kibdelosporangium banguiense TaxID=1365924 RepID=A0ABS4TGE7_9PSEU|nr:hypothetical protein [Kibdelosporangium banguiense]MBP2323493.1 hypothetical protein [Kibdelosporangium banguiense]